jgi:hypothetical protein
LLLVTNGQTPRSAASQWTAEVDVTPQLAADLIRDQFPDVGARQVAVLATGWDNVAFLVDGQWLFRFPRRAVAVPGVQREIAVLPRLAPRYLADHKYARQLSIIAGTGLIIFEAAELAWIGFQPLEAVFALVGVAVIGLDWRRPARDHEPSRGRP